MLFNRIGLSSGANLQGLKIWLLPLFLFFLPEGITAQEYDFSKAKIEMIGKEDPLLSKAALVLQDEIRMHSGIELPFTGSNAKENEMSFLVGTDDQAERLPPSCRSAWSILAGTGKDGFRISMADGHRTIVIMGHDARGALYGVGYLLRKMNLFKGKITVPDINISSSPTYSIRGHQLGYRPKTNAYDAWSVSDFDHYIRDLALFGANSIEILPPVTDDDFSNDLMKMPAIQMIREQSRICKDYGLDVWMWYPNMGSNYTNQDSVEIQLKEAETVFKVLPKLNALFVPGGDPGELEPTVLFRWLEKLAVVLHRYHPQAKIWVSPQVFRPTQEWFDSFYKEVNKEYPWFGGVVYGPWIKQPLKQVRQLVNKDIPIRHYPDITHSLSCQYPVADWDLAYAITLGRECYNPRPLAEKHIHNLFAGYTQGSLSYSEGINDDVNKFVWSGQDWNPGTPVMETLRDYARLFIGPAYADSFARGIMALEANFKGPLLDHFSVQKTLRLWQGMERSAAGELCGNFRFQMGLLRAYYDAYIQQRLVYETYLEKKARSSLKEAQNMGSIPALDRATSWLLKSADSIVSPELRAKCFALSDSVFNSIGSQLTVKKNKATAGRGNFMDNIDLPLNNSSWLLSQINLIKKIQGEQARLSAIRKLLNRTTVHSGSFYDNLGSTSGARRVVRQKTWEQDPGGLESPLSDFGVFLKGDEWVDVLPVGFEGIPVPQAWMVQATTLYNTPLILKYDHLDPAGNYSIRVAYTGRFSSNIKLVADKKYLVHDFIKTGTKPLFEFPVPREAVADGRVVFSFSCKKEDRGTQVAEVWLIKK